MTKYNIEFLEEKLGPFQKDYQYPTKSVSGFNLIYIETQTKKELDTTIKQAKEEINPGYIWGYLKNTEAIYVTRAFGENKIFIYNPTTIKKTDYVKGKLKVLNNLTADNLNELFDQKAVFDYFYKKLWDLRLDLGKEIRDKNHISDNQALMAAQNIIDRIIFTYFICEKELVTLNGQTTLNSKTLFNSIAKMPEPWKCLKNLYFEQFAKKESKPLLLGKNSQIITPYLNGGLFRPKTIDGISEINIKIEYSKQQWEELFEPLNKYTWIIEDEIPDHDGEYEGNLTPEIIGHIYEKFVITMETLDEIKLDELNISQSGDLKKGNKKIGAYYTPEHITDYISRNTIKPRLYDKLGITEDISFQEFLNISDHNTLKRALDVLNEITICDPACGSGAFLIKAGEILLEYKTKILKEIKNDIDRYHLKKQIIIKNIYGVDIQEGAVEICKLRLWLWLISSSQNQKVEPLPNIEYNFVVGNSLVGWTNENLEQSVLIQVNEMVLVILDALKLRFKSEIIDEIKRKLQKTDMRSYAEAMSLLKSIYSYSTEEEAEQLKDIIETIKNIIYKEINRIFYDYIKSKGTEISYEEYENFNPFHWKVDFNHIFQHKGFDIVIGNPPYVRHQGIVDKKIYLKNNFETYSGTADLYVYFFERGISILEKLGFLSYISSSKFIKVKYGFPLRKFLLNSKILKYVDLTKEDVFEDVAVYPSILVIKKEFPNEDHIIIMNNNIKIEQSRFDESNWIFEDPNSLNLYKKINDVGIPLGEIKNLRINRGLTTGFNKAFILNEKTKNELIEENIKNEEFIKPTIYGKDVKRWEIDFKNFYLLYIPPKFPIDHYNGIKKHLLKFKDDLEQRTEVINGNIDWFALRRYAPDYYHDFEAEKVIWSTLVNKPAFTVDKKGIFLPNSLYLLASDNRGYDLKYLLALLNSKLLFWVLKKISSEFRGDFYTYSKEFTNKLPIYPAKQEEQKPLILMAEEMLQLKKRLNEEVIYMHEWLQNTFKIKKLSLKLEKFYELSFDEFLIELKKKRVDIKSQNNYQIIKEKFERAMNAINPLLNKISETDKEIDFNIYKLYHLNDAEIQIVEDSLN